MAERLMIEDAIDAYLPAARLWNTHLQNQKPIPPDFLRELVDRAQWVFATYSLEENWADDQPRVPVPQGLAEAVEVNLQRIREGTIPDWMLHLRRGGEPSTDLHISLVVPGEPDKQTPRNLAIEAEIAGYRRAAAQCADIGEEGQSGSARLVRDIAARACRILYLYRMPENWSAERPIIPVPPELAGTVAENIRWLVAGAIPSWMHDLTNKGAPKSHPRMRLLIGLAVAYKKCCASGAIADRHATKTIAELYGVSRQCVQKWMKDYSDAEPADFFPTAHSEKERAEQIAAELPKAAERYRLWGRGTHNERLYGKAKSRSGSPRKSQKQTRR